MKCDCYLLCTREGLFSLSAASAERENVFSLRTLRLAVNTTIQIKYDIAFMKTRT